MTQAATQKMKVEVAKDAQLLQSPTRTQVDMMKLQQKAQVDTANLALKEREQDAKFIEILADMRNQETDNQIQAAKIDAENTRSMIEATHKISANMQESMNDEQIE
jgi:hypothetical protein